MADIGKYRRWFREAADFASDWREAARTDYEFVAGKQWDEADKRAFAQSGRPAITINRIKPLINVLSGYQRLNRYDIEFLPRTSDDMELCRVRQGMTKYILDRCNYDREESQVFLDAVIGGIGWFDVGYRFNDLATDGEAYVRREDPFGMYLDPETHALDFSDAKYICRAKWVTKDALSLAYPEHAEDIRAQYAVYDKAEHTAGKDIDPLWYKRDTDKARLVECWYKVKVPQTLYYLTDGRVLPKESIDISYFLEGLVAGQRAAHVTQVRVASFLEDVLLDDIISPYAHGDFPFVPLTCYHFGAEDLPAGFVRDLIDPQREINKRRIQELHILNTTGNGGGWIEEDAMTDRQKADFKKHGNIPGHYSEVLPGAISQGKILERATGQMPQGVIQAEAQAGQDLVEISGINEALMGVDIPNSASGRAIELKQKQAITHIAPMFDNLRAAKKKIAVLLWGEENRPGVVPQFYTEDKVYRVEGTNGQQFIRVNQDVVQEDPLLGTIHQTLNDLSVGAFDIVVSDVEASTTQRQAQMWGLVDAVSKLGVPGDMVFDLIIDLSDIPNKEEIKQRYAERLTAQQQLTQQQNALQTQQLEASMELARIQATRQSQSISFKDAPLPLQFAMAAKQGLIDPQVGQYAVDLMIEQLFPQLAEKMAAERQQQAAQEEQAAKLQQLQAMLQEKMQQNIPASAPNGAQGASVGADSQGQAPPTENPPATAQGSTMTKAALQSLLSGAAPAM